MDAHRRALAVIVSDSDSFRKCKKGIVSPYEIFNRT